MQSTFRTAVSVIVLSLALGLCTIPAHAQPRKGAQAEGIETGSLEAAWHWLTDLRGPCGLSERMQRALAAVTNSLTSSDLSLNRGGAYDPNGHS